MFLLAPPFNYCVILFHNLNQIMMQFSAQNLLMAPHLTRNKSQSSCNGTHKMAPTPSVTSVPSLTSFPFPAFLLAHATSSSDFPATSPKWQANFLIFTLGPSISSKVIPSPQVFFSNVILLKKQLLFRNTQVRRVSILDYDKKTHSGICLTDILGTKLKVINF